MIEFWLNHIAVAIWTVYIIGFGTWAILNGDNYD